MYTVHKVSRVLVLVWRHHSIVVSLVDPLATRYPTVPLGSPLE